MKLITKWLVILSFYTILNSVSAAEKQPLETNIIYISDLPLIENEKTGDYRNLSSLLTYYRDKNANTFFLFGGGSLGPSPMSSFDKGSHIIDILNTLEPDAMGLAKREFLYGEDELSLRAREAAFPIVGTNLFDPNTKENLNGILSNVIINKNNISIGVVSILEQDITEEYLIKKEKILAYRESIVQNALQLREKGADLVIIMYSNYSAEVDQLLNEKILDMAFMTDTGLESSKIAQLDLHPKHYFINKWGKAIIISLSSRDSHHFVQSSVEKDLKDFQLEAAVTDQVSTYIKRLNRLLGTEIVKLDGPMDTSYVNVRTQENEFANLVTDAIRFFSNSDIGLLNGGSIRGNKTYAKGTVLTKRDIATELPFRSHVVVIEVTGQTLQEAIINGFSRFKDMKGRFPHFSGLTVSLDIDGNVDLSSIRVNGQTLKLDKKYSLATSEYLSKGGDGYISLKNAPRLDSGLRETPLISEVLIAYLRSLPSVTPKIENRIIIKED